MTWIFDLLCVELIFEKLIESLQVTFKEKSKKIYSLIKNEATYKLIQKFDENPSTNLF